MNNEMHISALMDKINKLDGRLLAMEWHCEFDGVVDKVESVDSDRKACLADKILGLQEAMRPLLEEWSKLNEKTN